MLLLCWRVPWRAWRQPRFFIFCGFSFGQNRFTFDLCKSWVDSCSKSGQKFGFSCEKKWCLDALIKSTFATLCFFFLVEQTLPAANGTFFLVFSRFVSFGKFRFFVFLWGMVCHYLFLKKKMRKTLPCSLSRPGVSGQTAFLSILQPDNQKSLWLSLRRVRVRRHFQSEW